METQDINRLIKKEMGKLRTLEAVSEALDDLSATEGLALAAEARAKTAAMELARDVKALAEHRESAEYMKQSSIEEYDKLVVVQQAKIDALRIEESGLINKTADLKTQYRRKEAAAKNDSAEIAVRLKQEREAADLVMVRMRADEAAFKAKYVNGN